VLQLWVSLLEKVSNGCSSLLMCYYANHSLGLVFGSIVGVSLTISHMEASKQPSTLFF
jgi:hypothetical protein